MTKSQLTRPEFGALIAAELARRGLPTAARDVFVYDAGFGLSAGLLRHTPGADPARLAAVGEIARRLNSTHELLQ